MTLPFAMVDAVVVAVLLLSGLLAYFRGLVREVLSLATWIGAALAALYGFPYAQPYVRQVIAIDIVADIVAGVGLFLIALVVLTLLNHMISSRVKDSALGALDRGLGFLFGLFRGALIVAVAYIAATWFWTGPELAPYLSEARTAPFIRQGADSLRRIAPKEMRLKTRAAADDVRKTTGQVIETGQTLRRLQDAGRAKGGKPSAYDSKERREMQRLIDSNQ